MNDSVNRRRRGFVLGMAVLPISGIAATAQTPAASEGPFYPLPGMRLGDVDNDLVRVAGQVRQAGGEIVRFGGRVLDTAGQPIGGARVEIWQCDVKGRYLHAADRAGSTYDDGFQGFGHDVAASDGAYSFRTIKPVPYAGRTPHIHVKVLVANRERLTTQFYLPDHPGNTRDWLYRQVALEMREQVTLHFVTGADLPEARLDLVV